MPETGSHGGPNVRLEAESVTFLGARELQGADAQELNREPGTHAPSEPQKRWIWQIRKKRLERNEAGHSSH